MTNKEALKITDSVLGEWSACDDGREGFNKLFPKGADLLTAANGLHADGHTDWALWLFDHARRDERYKAQAIEGFLNAGHWNAGHWNAGDRNAGHSNAGDRNAGHWNAGDRNAGFFNTASPATVTVFNKPCKYEIWEAAYKPSFMDYIPTTYWVYESQMTDAEKAANPKFYCAGGELRKRPYKEAWAIAWADASESERGAVKKLPNFSAKVFEEITGIKV